MLIAFLAGIILGYAWKLREHDREIEAVMRIAKRIREANYKAPKKEGAPKGPLDGKVHQVYGRPC